jgi:hypothetical protein
MGPCQDPEAMGRIQFRIERAYETLASLTRLSRELLKDVILAQYPEWAG